MKYSKEKNNKIYIIKCNSIFHYEESPGILVCADDCVFPESAGAQQRDPAVHEASAAFVVFNRFWTIMELYSTKNEDIYQALDTHTMFVRRYIVLLVVVEKDNTSF